MKVKNVHGNLRIICASNRVDTTREKIIAFLTELGIKEHITAEPIAYWKTEGQSVLEWAFKADSVDAEQFQNVLASICHAETTKVLVEDGDVEISCYNNGTAMEADPDLMFAVCYIKTVVLDISVS